MGNQCLRRRRPEPAPRLSGPVQTPSRVHYAAKRKSSREAIYTAWDTPRYMEPVTPGSPYQAEYLSKAVEPEYPAPELPPPMVHPRRSAGVRSGTLASQLTGRSIRTIEELEDDNDIYQSLDTDIYYNTSFVVNRNELSGYRNNAFLEGDELDRSNRNSYMDRSSYFELPLSVHHEGSFMSEDVTDLALQSPTHHRSTPVAVDSIPSIDYSLSFVPKFQTRRVVSIFPPSSIPPSSASSSKEIVLVPRSIQSNNRLSIFPPPRTQSRPVPSPEENDLGGEIANDGRAIIDESAIMNTAKSDAGDYVDMSSKQEAMDDDYLEVVDEDDYMNPADMQLDRQSVVLEPKTASSLQHIRPSSTHCRPECDGFITRDTAESESQVIKGVSKSELARLIRWLGEQDWARHYFDGQDGFYIGSRNKSDDEVTELLRRANFENIPIIPFDVDSFIRTYKRTGPIPGTHLFCNQHPNRYILSSGSLRTSTQEQIITVGHLFEPVRDIGVQCIAYESNDSYCVGRLLDVIEDVKITDNPLSYDRIHADVAFLEPDPTECVVDNRITFTSPYGPDRRFQLCLYKGDIFKCTKVMILDQNNVVQYGHIASTLFTDKDNGLYNAISVVNTNEPLDCAITGDGDSGALVMQYQDIATCGYTDVLVYGLVTGVFTRKPREDGRIESLTIVNRLWDVLRYCDRIHNAAIVDFRATP